MREPRPARLVAIDPGPHTGVAVFEHGRFDEETGQVEDYKSGWRCVHVQEFEPLEFGRWLYTALIQHEVDAVVYETWQIYPDRVKALIGSKCETAEVIGMVKWLVADANARLYHGAVDLSELPAGAKLPVPAWCRARKIKATYKRLGVPGQHVKDAELLGWAWVARVQPNSAPVPA